MRPSRYLILIVIILVVTGLALPFVVPADVIADQIAKITKDRTGRDLSLGGNISFSVYPDLAISMRDVSLSSPPGMPKGVMLSTGKLRLSLQVAPLLSGNIKVKAFELVEPRLNLLTDVNGNNPRVPTVVSHTPGDPTAVLTLSAPLVEADLTSSDVGDLIDGD